MHGTNHGGEGARRACNVISDQSYDYIGGREKEGGR